MKNCYNKTALAVIALLAASSSVRTFGQVNNSPQSFDINSFNNVPSYTTSNLPDKSTKAMTEDEFNKLSEGSTVLLSLSEKLVITLHHSNFLNGHFIMRCPDVEDESKIKGSAVFSGGDEQITFDPISTGQTKVTVYYIDGRTKSFVIEVVDPSSAG